MQDKDDATIQMLKEIIKADIEKYPGYYINDNGDVIHNCNPKNLKTIEQADIIYDGIKDCSKYVKAVTNLNYIYSNMITNNTMQSYMDNNADFQFNIMLPMIDTYFVYQILKDNEILLSKKKKTKLKCDKINPISDYTKKASYIELAIKNYNKLDDDTKIEIIDAVFNTIKDADTIDNVDYYNMDYLKEFADINNIKDMEVAKELVKLSKDDRYKDHFIKK